LAKAIEESMEGFDLDNLFGEVLSTQELVISNEAGLVSASGPAEKSHTAVRNFMSVPVHYRHDFVGLALLANHQTGFETSLLDSMQPILDAYGAALFTRRHTETTEQTLHRADIAARLLSSALEESTSGILVEDESLSVLFANEAFCRLFGQTIPPECLVGVNTDELRGRSIHYYVNPEEAKAFIKQCQSLRPVKAEAKFELRCGTKFQVTYRGRATSYGFGHCWVYEK
jgi:PAS domain-containing protein